jgi:hypothetical protein
MAADHKAKQSFTGNVAGLQDPPAQSKQVCEFGIQCPPANVNRLDRSPYFDE